MDLDLRKLKEKNSTGIAIRYKSNSLLKKPLTPTGSGRKVTNGKSSVKNKPWKFRSIRKRFQKLTPIFKSNTTKPSNKSRICTKIILI